MIAAAAERGFLLVTGSGGRVGRGLRSVWSGNSAGSVPILWHDRRGGSGVDVVWDIGQNPPIGWPEGGIVLHLAGHTTGSPEKLAENISLTREVCELARARCAAAVWLMSTAAVYRPGPELLSEADVPDPVSEYGRAKLAAERVAAQVLSGSQTRLTVFRLGNLAGADGLLSACMPGRIVVLDPIAGQVGGPERSYIGPQVLGNVLAGLVSKTLPPVLNLAQPGVIAMADLLRARGQVWQFGPERAGAVARVVLATGRLESLVPVPSATAAGMIADLDGVAG
ncbi:MAG: NAD-dependent epimerase/dehydratase family protein [bacterium]